MTSKHIKALEHIKSSFDRHTGHVLAMNYGEARESGVLVRVTIEGDNVMLWIDQGDLFPNRFYFDQVHECSCGEGKKGENKNE